MWYQISRANLLAAVLLAIAILPLRAIGAFDPGIERIATQVIEIPRVTECQISPIGLMVAYTVVEASVAENEYRIRLCLQRLSTAHQPEGVAIEVSASTETDGPSRFYPRWRPRTGELSYLRRAPGSSQSGRELVLLDTATAKSFVCALRDTEIPGEGGRPQIRSIPADFKWSPTGSSIAFTAQAERVAQIDSRKGVTATIQQHSAGISRPRYGLFVLDVKSGALERVSPSDLHIREFDWAPEGDRLVFSAAPDADGVSFFRTDLYVVDSKSKHTVPLVVQPGMDGSPSWSSDGEWVVFSSQFGVHEYFLGSTALVSTISKTIIRVNAEPGVELSSPDPVWWFDQGKTARFLTRHHMTSGVARMDRAANSVSAEADSRMNLRNLSFSEDRVWAAYTLESCSESPAPYIQRWPDGERIQLPGRGIVSPPLPITTEKIVWRDLQGGSAHGLLLKPVSAPPPKGWPTIVCLDGGPSMVENGFARDALQGGAAAIASTGYAVLLPNTRGRGGFGRDSKRAIQVEQSAMRGPYEDLATGIDHLIQQGISDPKRLGIVGHSYGATLAAYTITQTDRFRAATIYEGSHNDRLTPTVGWSVAGSDWAIMTRDVMGAGVVDPFSPAERARLIDESPLFNMHRVSTPALLIYGAQAGAKDAAQPLFGALQRAGVPSELRVYAEGHVVRRPAAQVDLISYIHFWFGRWLGQEIEAVRVSDR